MECEWDLKINNGDSNPSNIRCHQRWHAGKTLYQASNPPKPSKGFFGTPDPAGQRTKATSTAKPSKGFFGTPDPAGQRTKATSTAKPSKGFFGTPDPAGQRTKVTGYKWRFNIVYSYSSENHPEMRESLVWLPEGKQPRYRILSKYHGPYSTWDIHGYTGMLLKKFKTWKLWEKIKPYPGNNVSASVSGEPHIMFYIRLFFCQVGSGHCFLMCSYCLRGSVSSLF